MHHAHEVFCSSGPRYLARALSQIYSPLDKDIVRESWVAGNLKEQLGIRHRYRKNNDDYEVPENTSLFDNGRGRDADIPEFAVNDDYTPVRPGRTPSSALRTPPDSDTGSGSNTPPPGLGSRSRSESKLGSQDLLDVRADSTGPISPALSYYSASAIPVSTTTSPI